MTNACSLGLLIRDKTDGREVRMDCSAITQRWTNAVMSSDTRLDMSKSGRFRMWRSGCGLALRYSVWARVAPLVMTRKVT
ncbi:hypothetical protein HanRHA438_Chr08g0370051 [Helianthus annuus]|nr:hypothetical protein HanRHA438_Chr08g0370051 [Helianthus annuus]